MSRWKSSLCLVVVTLNIGWASSGNAQVTVDITKVTVPGGSIETFYGNQQISINDSGTIAGSYFDKIGIHGFVRQIDGLITKFDPPESRPQTLITGINASGTITGYYSPNIGPSYAGFLRDALGQYTTFSLPGATETLPLSINSSGDVAGYYYAGGPYSFIRSSSGVITTLVDLAYTTAINDSGTIAGYGIYDDNHLHGFIRNAGGEVTKVEIPGSTEVYIHAFNAKGDILGYAWNVGYFIRDSAGKVTVLPNTVYTASFFGINEEGDICGVNSSSEPIIRLKNGKIIKVAGGVIPIAINSSRIVTGYSGGRAFFISSPLTSFDYSSGFSTASDSLNLTGSAAVNGSQLMLTNGNDSEASSAFYGYPVDIRSFTTDFTFVPSDAVADGLTFTIQNDDPYAVGFPGAGLGYQRINQSVALKFDFHNNFGEGPNSTGLYLNGVSPTVPAVDLSQSGINLASGDPIKVHVTYDSATNGGDLTLTLTDETNMHTWTKSFTVDIPTTVGATTAYVGFTASTGEKTSNLAIASWSYQAGT